MFDLIDRLQDHLRRAARAVLPVRDLPDPEEAAAPPPDEPDPRVRYAFLRDILEKHGFSDSVIEAAQLRHADVARISGIWMSGPNELDGWRRVAVIGIEEGSARVLGVTSDGLFRMADVTSVTELRQVESPRLSPTYKVLSQKLQNKGPWVSRDTLIGPLPATETMIPLHRVSAEEIAAALITPDDRLEVRERAAMGFTFNIFERKFRTFCHSVNELRINHFLIISMQEERIRGARIKARVMDEKPALRQKIEEQSRGEFDQIRCGMGRLLHPEHARIQRRMRGITRELRNALDPEVVRLMRSTLVMDGEEAAWLAGGFADDDGQVRRADPARALARQQALRIFPVLRAILQDPAVTRVIDAREPLIPALSRRLEVSETVIRAMKGLTWQRLGCSPHRLPLSRILALEAHHMPADRKGFRKLEALEQLAAQTGLPAEAIIARAKGRFDEAMHQLRRVAPGSLNDTLADVFKRLVIPAIILKHPEIESVFLAQNGMTFWMGRATEIRTAFFEACISRMSLKDLVDASIGWHTNLGRIDRDIGIDARVAHWTPLIGRLEMPDGIVVREITSLPGLRIQGKHQRHCVGTYGDRVTGWNGMAGSICTIFSVERDGEVLSTAEILTTVGDRPEGSLSVAGARVNQNYALGNRTAPKETEAPIEEVRRRMARLTAEDLARHHAGLQAWRQSPVNGMLTRRAAALECDIERPDYLDVAWKALSPILPRSIRKAGLDALLEIPGIALAIEEQTRRQREAELRKAAREAAMANAEEDEDEGLRAEIRVAEDDEDDLDAIPF
ncbi:PcfJ domain-containing protein [Cereibacter sphaeroides]|uniref:PcfJ domain-containing protein n=1 Tax=Cereibacter sphaeroides TaxID=1063 RepID=UPI001F1D9892|nr:PcfJ domain-containing protein [Cereibacter sphaeroides]MCE6959674.1 PcfJ domain-containing protein [Cereibacter sphaeroides]MCE6974465.1 PcfJ domain-containing protein [Cereibacter sphaeroides]